MVRRVVLALLLISACGDDDGQLPGVDGDLLPIDAAVVDVIQIDAAGPGPFLEFFPNDGAGWPGWAQLGGVASATVESGRGRLIPTVSSYSLGRMGATAGPVPALDIDSTFTIEFTDISTQGIGFYVRQNGGYLQQSTPHGRGYAVFIEGFRGPRIGLWRERDGVEEERAFTDLGAGGLADGTVYRVRFQIEQLDTTSDLRAKIWPVTDVEPLDWMVMGNDDLPELQNIAGFVAVDAWNTATPPAGAPAPMFIDEIYVQPF